MERDFCFVSFSWHNPLPCLQTFSFQFRAEEEQFEIAPFCSNVVNLEDSLSLGSRRVKILYLKSDSGPQLKLDRLPVPGYNLKNSSSYDNDY